MPLAMFTLEAKNLLGTLEGNELTAYQDGGGIWTIGRGSTRDVCRGMVITPEESDERFEEDITATCDAVDRAIEDAALNPNQYSAFVIFAFNVKGWQHVPLTAHVKALDIDGCRAHWLLYDKIEKDGVKVPSKGLQKRRRAELDLFLAPVISA